MAPARRYATDTGVMLAKFSLFRGESPPTLIEALWHAGFSVSRNPFAQCYYKKDNEACEYLRQFGRTREEQARVYYLWAQTVPTQFWRFFSMFSLTYFASAVADMVPPLAIANLLRVFDLYPYFRDTVVTDLFAGVCGWLMAFAFFPSHYLPRRWIAVDIDGWRLQICKLVGNELGVDVVTVKRDLSTPVALNTDVAVGSPPCHEFSVAKVSSERRIHHGLILVRSFLESTKGVPVAVMEESVSTKDARRHVTNLVVQYGLKHVLVKLRDFGAIQYARERLIAFRTP